MKWRCVYPFWLWKLAFLFVLQKLTHWNKSIFFKYTHHVPLFLLPVYFWSKKCSDHILTYPIYLTMTHSKQLNMKHYSFHVSTSSLFAIELLLQIVFFALKMWKSSFSGSTYLLSEFEPICTVHTQCYNSTDNFHFLCYHVTFRCLSTSCSMLTVIRLYMLISFTIWSKEPVVYLPAWACPDIHDLNL